MGVTLGVFASPDHCRRSWKKTETSWDRDLAVDCSRPVWPALWGHDHQAAFVAGDPISASGSGHGCIPPGKSGFCPSWVRCWEMHKHWRDVQRSHIQYIALLCNRIAGVQARHIGGTCLEMSLLHQCCRNEASCERSSHNNHTCDSRPGHFRLPMDPQEEEREGCLCQMRTLNETAIRMEDSPERQTEVGRPT